MFLHGLLRRLHQPGRKPPLHAVVCTCRHTVLRILLQVLYSLIFQLVFHTVRNVGRVLGWCSPVRRFTHTHPLAGHPGPKSGGRPRALPACLTLQRVFALLIFHLIREAQAGSGTTDVRVGGNPHQEPPEAVHPGFNVPPTEANINGVFIPKVCHPKPVRKRAFIRAQHRASQQGFAKYRGKWWSAQELGSQVRRPAVSAAGPCVSASRANQLPILECRQPLLRVQFGATDLAPITCRQGG